MACVQLPKSFQGTSLFSRRSQGRRLNVLPGFRITCSSLQFHGLSAPISERHISSLLTSSLQVQTPQGESLLAMTNERVPSVLISQAASEQLELLAAAAAECMRSKDQEDVLKRRIADIKEREISKALQDITLALVTHRLNHALLAMPDQIPRQQAENTVAPPQDNSLDNRLRALHPSFMQPLIDSHVGLVVNGKDRAQLPFDPHMRARVSAVEMGKLYAASIMHGYFLARVYQRFKLERVLQLEAVPVDLNKQTHEFGVGGLREFQSKEVSMLAYLQSQVFEDKEALHHLNSVRCPHTLNVIETHCQALFGVHRKAFHTSSILNIQLSFVKSLILQALSFGALLWDVENYFISSFYHFHD